MLLLAASAAVADAWLTEPPQPHGQLGGQVNNHITSLVSYYYYLTCSSPAYLGKCANQKQSR